MDNVEVKTKFCLKCECEYPLDNFFSRGGKRKNELQAYCKECYREVKRDQNRAKPHLQRNRALRKNYGIEPEDFAAMLEKQNGVCLICGKPETALFRGKVRQLSVDHNHKTKQIRGLLCIKCNSLIAMADDNVNTLVKAIRYLDSYSS